MHRPPEPFHFDKIAYAAAGTIVYPPGGRYGPRIQEDIQFVLLHTGSLTVEVDGESRVVQPGTVTLLVPGGRERFFFADEQESWHRWIAVHFDGLTGDERGSLARLPLSLPISGEMNRLVDLMLAMRDEQEPRGVVMRSLGQAALQLYLSETGRALESRKIHPSVQLAKNEIHRSFAGELTLAGIARVAGVSPEHLVRLFRSAEKTTPIKYVWHYRVLRALELLTHTGLSITEISARCGFKTTYHFARLVKQQTGRTPSELRSASWKAQEPER